MLNYFLKKIGINSSYQLNKLHVSSEGKSSCVSTIFISGKSNLHKWFSIVGPKNEIHTIKYEIWKKFGFCPPKISLDERKLIINEKINPKMFYAEARI